MRILLVDDERVFADDRAEETFTESSDLIDFFLDENGHYNGVEVDQIWLDFCLYGDDSGANIAFFASNQAKKGTPLKVDVFVLHTTSWGGADLMKRVLEDAGYKTERVDITVQKKIFVTRI